MKVAIVHDWLSELGGAEKVIKELYECYPQADVFALVNNLEEPQLKEIFGDNIPKITTTFIDKIPYFRKKYQKLFFLFPVAMESFDLSDYDLIISSSSSCAKGVMTSPSQTHVCYCHSPARYAWDLMHGYLNDAGLKGFARLASMFLLSRYKIWDAISANQVTHFIANSHFVGSRIKKYYNRDFEVIYPPVSEKFSVSETREDYYFFVSRLVPYKRADLIIEAFKKLPNKKVLIAGSGPEHEKLSKMTEGFDNIQLLGRVSDEELDKYMSEAKAFIFLALEDFGIAPVEAQMAGVPVIGLNKGGVSETVVHEKTGLLIEEQKADLLIKAIEQFESESFNAQEIREHAENFSSANFRQQMVSFVEKAMS